MEYRSVVKNINQVVLCETPLGSVFQLATDLGYNRVHVRVVGKDSAELLVQLPRGGTKEFMLQCKVIRQGKIALPKWRLSPLQVREIRQHDRETVPYCPTAAEVVAAMQ